MKTYDVIVIGGGPSGIVTAATAKKQHQDMKMLMVTQEPRSMVPCGIPYVFHDLGEVDKNVMGPKPFVDLGGELCIDSVTKVDVKSRTITVASGDEFGFEKLVFATGSRPVRPSFLKGYDLKQGVAYVPKSYAGIRALKEQADAVKRIVVLGSGFTAVELAEQLAKDPQKEVHLVYRAQYCLQRSFSEDFAKRIDETLRQTSIHLHAQSQVTEILGKDDRATGIRLEDGSTLAADLVVVAMGYQANTEIAAAAGIDLNKHDQIVVDNYLRTPVAGVYAVGDCAQTCGFITGRTDNIMLASTAAAEARVLGHNLRKIRIKRNFPGTLSVFSTELNGVAFASAGAFEKIVQQDNIDYIIGSFQDIDRHPGTIPDAAPLAIKITVMPDSGQIIGGEVCGGKSVGELINTLALAIQKHVTVYELISFQIGTHPLLTTAPTKPVLIKAAEDALAKITH